MYIAGGGFLDRLVMTLLQAWMKRRGSKKMRVHRGFPNSPENVARLTELVEDGAVRPVIDKRCGLSQVPEALEFVEQGLAKGKVVVAVAGGGAETS